MKEIIKKLSDTIDKNVGIVSHAGGAWGDDFPLNHASYSIQTEISPEWMAEKFPIIQKNTGTDSYHFHHSPESFRQGDFKYTYYKDSKEFKEKVTDVLEKEGVSAGIHTYSFYINYECDPILSKRENLKDLCILKNYTLKQDLTEDSDFIKTLESTHDISPNLTSRQSPFVLIGDELIRFEKAEGGFKVVKRGAGGTKATSHKKGDVVKHVHGHYHCIASRPGSDLFFDIARRTAAAYNEGGYKIIYLDAFDGIRFHCDESWYYCAAFVTELLKYCKDDPVIEYSWILPSIWAARGRFGAYDVAARAYKEMNRRHVEANAQFDDRFGTATLGWYSFYPQDLAYPGDTNVRYHHTDAIEHVGALAIAHDYGNVFHLKHNYFAENAGVKRNVNLYKKYDEVRKAHLFPKEVLDTVKSGKWEYHLKEKRGKKFVFVEKDYQSRRLYDIFDPLYQTSKFKNPFGRQTPFVRIEPLLSTRGENPVTLLDFDEKKDLIEQNLKAEFETPLDLSRKMANKVRIKGNGKKGSAVNIKLYGRRGFAEFFIDTDFRGTRDFILIELDNGERPDLSFDNPEYTSHFHAVTCYGYQPNCVKAIEIMTEGDMTGVKMSSVVACDHVYDVFKNPTLKIGETEVSFQCEITSSEYIEFNGKEAVVFDRYANKKNIYFESNLKAPKGKFKAEFSAVSLNNLEKPRALITFGFTGKEVK